MALCTPAGKSSKRTGLLACHWVEGSSYVVPEEDVIFAFRKRMTPLQQLSDPAKERGTWIFIALKARWNADKVSRYRGRRGRKSQPLKMSHQS
jgi:hypothetical protein